MLGASHEFFSSGLSQSRSYYSSSSLHSKSSTLSSRKSSASVISISTNKTPVVPRKSIKQNKPEQMVTIKESYIETELSTNNIFSEILFNFCIHFFRMFPMLNVFIRHSSRVGHSILWVVNINVHFVVKSGISGVYKFIGIFNIQWWKYILFKKCSKNGLVSKNNYFIFFHF